MEPCDRCLAAATGNTLLLLEKNTFPLVLLLLFPCSHNPSNPGHAGPVLISFLGSSHQFSYDQNFCLKKSQYFSFFKPSKKTASSRSSRFIINLNPTALQSVWCGLFHYRRAGVLLRANLGSKYSHQGASLRNNLHLDGAPITSESHTHPSHSETSRLLTSSLSLGVSVPRPTQCIRDV